MPLQTIYLWKQAPFLRLLLPLIAGIVLQWYTGAPAIFLYGVLAISVGTLLLFNARTAYLQFRMAWVNGVLIHLLFTALGMLLIWHADIRHRNTWIKHHYQATDAVRVLLKEPLSEKANSYKAVAAALQIQRADTAFTVEGNIILYFDKKLPLSSLQPGTVIVLKKPLQPIKNTGNPAAFNFERYAAFQDIYQQVYLQGADFVVLTGMEERSLSVFLYTMRDKLLNVLTGFIPGKKEAGMAEALLLGFKDDLDKELLQRYANTGVVHVIAISGMHLGLIYWLLAMVTSPLKKKPALRWLVPVLIISLLWLFALLTGGGPSILRSAVMFTCIVIAENSGRKTYIYNSLAAAAFVLLCINPFWLWDAGFQLSFGAVLSIVIFMKPIYNWFYFTNPMVDGIWKLSAVTMAAQVLTTPVSMFHFHQFPIYFLFTNLLAVPLSSLIVLLEIGLCCFSGLPAIAHPAGQLIHWLIESMNQFIGYMEQLPFSVWSGMQITVLQALLLYAVIAALSSWLMRKNKTALLAALTCLLAFFVLRSQSFISANNQQLFIVYNIPKKQAVHFIKGRSAAFMGDNHLPQDSILMERQLLPARILYRLQEEAKDLLLAGSGPLYVFDTKRIVLIDCNYEFPGQQQRVQADLIILSKNAPVTLASLAHVFTCTQIIADASNNAAKVHKWKEEAAKLGLHCFSVVDNGAFVMNMD